MQIVGGHDYYDTALAFGHDAATRYVRGSAEVGEEELEALGIGPADHYMQLVDARTRTANREYQPARGVFSDVTLRGTHYAVNAPVVIACGKRYQGLRVNSWTGASGRESSTYFWSRARLEPWLAERGLHLDRFRDAQELDDYFTPTELRGRARAALVERGWTILTHDPAGSYYGRRRTPWKVDQPVLKSLEFFRAVPPDLIFQEIEMWVGGVLAVAAPEMERITDADRLAKHGMDDASFRGPTGEKRRGKRRKDRKP